MLPDVCAFDGLLVSFKIWENFLATEDTPALTLNPQFILAQVECPGFALE